MKVLIFDPFCGASGDMIIGCLVSLGADAEKIAEVMEQAAHVTAEFEETQRGPIIATRAIIHAEEGEPQSLADIEDRIGDLGLGRVEECVLGVFRRIARAESKVHGVPLEQIHFHEVGAEDAIADVVGACVALDLLDLDDIRTTSIGVGGGMIDTEHGWLPVPAPATLEILGEAGLQWHGGPVEAELLTPTGAALLAEFTRRSIQYFPNLTTQRIGYGAGAHSFDVPNVLRGIVGVMEDGLVWDDIALLETNVDDVTGEILGHLIERLMEEGARDVTVIPATMKKGRSGHIVRVVAKPHDAHHLSRVIVEETGSLGVRVLPTCHRLIAKRRMETVEVRLGERDNQIGVKVATDTEGRVLDVSAEYEDCRSVAREIGLPLREVIRRAEDKAWEVFGESP